MSLSEFLVVFVTKFVHPNKCCTDVVDLGLPEIEQIEEKLPHQLQQDAISSYYNYAFHSFAISNIREIYICEDLTRKLKK